MGPDSGSGRPPLRPWERRPLAWTAGGLLLLAALSVLPDFRESIVPNHDARQYHCAFHVYYTGLLHENEVPQWLPYGRYGNSSFLLLMYVTPVGHLVALAGRLLGIVHTLPMFKVVVLLEFLLFMAGSIRLSSLLYRRLAAVALVNVGAILSFSWLISLDSNFHTYYLLPYILYHLLRFLREGRVTQLLLSGLFCAVSTIGNVPYYPPLLAIFLTVFTGAFLATERRLPRPRFAPIDAALLAAILLIGVSFVGGYLLNLKDLSIYSQGRDPVSRKVDFKSYLTYGGITRPLPLANAVLTGVHTHGDNTYYVGLATLVLAGVAVAKCRSGEFTATGVSACFLVLFSFGGYVAAAAYYFPGMSYYRHVALIFGQVRYLLLLLAGFGLDQLLRPAEAPPAKRRNFVPGLVLAALLLVEAVKAALSDAPDWEFFLYPPGLDPTLDAWFPVLFRIAVYGLLLGLAVAVARRRAPHRKAHLLTGALLLAFFVDVGSFKMMQFRNWPELDAPSIATCRDTFRALPVAYQPVRVSGVAEEERNPTLGFLVWGGRLSVSSARYVHFYSIAGVDPRIPTYRTDFLVSGVGALLEARKAWFYVYPSERLLPAGDRWLFAALGATAPKLRLVRDSDAVLRAPASAPAAVKALPLDSEAVVISDGAPETPSPSAPDGPPGSIPVRDFGFNKLVAEATVTAAGGAWVYYADADHQGWRATVDGSPVPILRANLGFKAVRLPGRHRIEFRFWNGAGSAVLYILGAVSILFLAGMGAAFLRWAIRTTCRPAETAPERA